MGSCQFYYERFKHVKKQLLSSQVVDKQLKTSQILLSHIQDDTSQNLVFSVEKKLVFNITSTPRTFAFGRGMVLKDPEW